MREQADLGRQPVSARSSTVKAMSCSTWKDHGQKWRERPLHPREGTATGAGSQSVGALAGPQREMTGADALSCDRGFSLALS